MLLAILTNSVLLAITASEPKEYGVRTFYGALELSLFLLFFLEAVIKIGAWGRLYFHDSWNLIDARSAAPAEVPFAL